MKKRLAILLSLVMILSVVFTGCSAKKADAPKEAEKTAATTEAPKKPVKIVLLVNGTLGDKSFFDSANEGMKTIKEKYGAETKTIEMSNDETKWEPTLQDVSEQDWDIIIVGTWQMTENLEKVAATHKDKKYFIFDSTVDYAKGDFKNVYSINYKQNEASFLAGALAAKITTSKMPLANADKKIGFLGGMDIPVINDFLVGYIQGAKYIDKDAKVAISYIGNFTDSAKGKEMALAQYNSGIDVGFNVAGQAGLGQLDAAKEKKKYAIGVDSDQALLFAEKDKSKSELIATSVLKRIDMSLVRAVGMHIDGTIKYGAAETLGFTEKGVGLADNEFYKSIVSEEYRTLMDDIAKKITSGEIKVDSAMGMGKAKLDEIRNSVK